MAKTKALISCAVTAQLICVFVFAYANCCFSHAKAPILLQVFYVDYGNTCQMATEELRELPTQLLDIPFQVRLSCSLLILAKIAAVDD